MLRNSADKQILMIYLLCRNVPLYSLLVTGEGLLDVAGVCWRMYAHAKG